MRTDYAAEAAVLDHCRRHALQAGTQKDVQADRVHQHPSFARHLRVPDFKSGSGAARSSDVGPTYAPHRRPGIPRNICTQHNAGTDDCAGNGRRTKHSIAGALSTRRFPQQCSNADPCAHELTLWQDQARSHSRRYKYDPRGAVDCSEATNSTTYYTTKERKQQQQQRT